jgi:hypothetical protein
MPPRELERGCLQAHFGGGFFCWVILAFGKKLGGLLRQFDVLAQLGGGSGRSERHRSLMQHKIRWRLPTTIRLAHGRAPDVVTRRQDVFPRSLPTFRQLPCPCDPGAMNGPLLQSLFAKRTIHRPARPKRERDTKKTLAREGGLIRPGAKRLKAWQRAKQESQTKLRGTSRAKRPCTPRVPESIYILSYNCVIISIINYMELADARKAAING